MKFNGLNLRHGFWAPSLLLVLLVLTLSGFYLSLQTPNSARATPAQPAGTQQCLASPGARAFVVTCVMHGERGVKPLFLLGVCHDRAAVLCAGRYINMVGSP